MTLPCNLVLNLAYGGVTMFHHCPEHCYLQPYGGSVWLDRLGFTGLSALL